jgi:hypothetical protein
MASRQRSIGKLPCNSQIEPQVELTRIGRFYNGRDNSTVCYAIKRIQALRESNAEVGGPCLL